MKIVHILHELKFSGAEIMYVDAASVFQNKGYELLVVATAPQLGVFASNFEQAGYQVFHKPFPRLINYVARINYYREFIKFIKVENIDVVHIHSHGSMWSMALCAWITKVKSVRTFHSIFPSNWYSYFYHCLLRWSAKNIFKCKFQSIGNSVHDHELKLYWNKTIMIENWYGSNRYFPAGIEEKKRIRQELDISDNAFVLISVGGCDHNKRHHDIIKALSLVIEQIPDIFYLHLGKGETEKEEIELAENLELTENIRFCGNQQNVRKYLVASDVYLMTSRAEGMPITALEAMACNLPSIFYDVKGLRDFNKNGKNSILIPDDYKVLAKKIIYLYFNPEKAVEIANNATSMVNKYYNMDRNANSICGLYL